MWNHVGFFWVFFNNSSTKKYLKHKILCQAVPVILVLQFMWHSIEELYDTMLSVKVQNVLS